jgi:hypothetical protein
VQHDGCQRELLSRISIRHAPTISVTDVVGKSAVTNRPSRAAIMA